MDECWWWLLSQEVVVSFAPKFGALIVSLVALFVQFVPQEALFFSLAMKYLAVIKCLTKERIAPVITLGRSFWSASNRSTGNVGAPT